MLEKLLTCEEIKAQLAELREREKLLIKARKKAKEVAALEAQCEKLDHTPIDLKALVQHAADAFGVRVARMYSRNREEPIANARFVVWAIAREFTTYSNQQLAELFNRGCHSTVIYGERTAKKFCLVDPAFKARYERIRNAFLAAQANGNGVASGTK